MTDDRSIEAALAPRSLTTVTDNLQPLVEVVRDAIGESPLFGLRLNEATPAQRREIVRLRLLLKSLADPVNVRLKQLDEAVKVAYARTGSDTFPVGKGYAIGLSKPQQAYTTEVQKLRDALVGLIPENVITLEEINAAIAPYTDYKVDHRKLNALRDHRGELVAEAIEKYRHKPPIDPTRMRVNWPSSEGE